MESPKQMETGKQFRRIARAVEVIIRKCIYPKYRLPQNEYYLVNIEQGMQMYREKCYPMGLADERIADYILYQIYRYRDMIGVDSRWTIVWLFTQNAVEKYRAQFLSKGGKSGMYYYIHEWMDDNELTMQRVLNVIAEPKPNEMAKYVYMPSEEPIKRRWLNTEAGYTLCGTSTTGWSPQSRICNQCNYVGKCRVRMQTKYPELLRIRKEIQNG